MKFNLKITAGAIALLVSAGVAQAGMANASVSHGGHAPVPAAQRYYDVVRADAPGQDATVYRPLAKNSKSDGNFPIVVFGNGGCRDSNEEVITLLTEIAAHGFVVVADGSASARFTEPIGPSTSAKLTKMVDWAVSDKGLKKTVDRNKVAVIGQSCGAGNALTAGADKRVDSVVAMNGSTNSGGVPNQAKLDALHTPTLWMDGGPTDVAFKGVGSDFAAVKTSIPAMHLSAVTAGHIGMMHGTNDPAALKAGVTPQGQELEVDASNFLVAWFDYTLNGNAAAGASIIHGCTFCESSPAWTVESKGIH